MGAVQWRPVVGGNNSEQVARIATRPPINGVKFLAKNLDNKYGHFDGNMYDQFAVKKSKQFKQRTNPLMRAFPALLEDRTKALNPHHINVDKILRESAVLNNELKRSDDEQEVKEKPTVSGETGNIDEDFLKQTPDLLAMDENDLMKHFSEFVEKKQKAGKIENEEEIVEKLADYMNNLDVVDDKSDKSVKIDDADEVNQTETMFKADKQMMQQLQDLDIKPEDFQPPDPGDDIFEQYKFLTDNPGEYEIVEQLGKGSQGSIFLCQHVEKKFQIVVKIDTRTKSWGSNIPIHQHYLYESNTLKELEDHPNIVQYKTHYRSKTNCICLMIDFVGGGDLLQAIDHFKQSKEANFTVDEVKTVLRQSCAALSHLHEQNIIHRDIKPANLLLTSESGIKIADFGLARKLDDKELQYDGRFENCGTLSFMAPDYANDSYSTPVDVWALGIVIYEMIMLQKPFTGNSDFNLIAKILAGKYEDIPEDYEPLGTVVKAMLEPDPEKRVTAQRILQYLDGEVDLDELIDA